MKTIYIGANNTKHLSLELRLLITCCQVDLSEDEINFIQNSFSTIDYRKLSDTASRHAVLPLVYKTLKNLFPSDLSAQRARPKGQMPLECSTLNAQLLTNLKSDYMRISQRNMLKSAELIKILNLFSENHIEALAFKGPTLAQMAYGNITLRQYSDLDILIHSNDRTQAAALLEANGYEALLSLAPKQEIAWYSNSKEMNFYHPKKRIHIDLQWQFFDNDYPLKFRQDIVWKNTSDISLNGNPIKTFLPDSLLIYLCTHGSKHLWERIGWIKDIDLLIRSQTLNWDRIREQIDGSGFKRMFLLGLYLTSTLFDTPLPEAIKKQMQNQKWLEKLGDYVVDDWSQHRGKFYNSAAMLHLFPTWGTKLKYLNKIILKPSKNEYRYMDLPEKLHWLYFLLRPYLLIRKYLSR